MSDTSKLCDDKCLPNVPRGQRRVLPDNEYPYDDYSATSTTTTTTTTTTTLFPQSLNNLVKLPESVPACPIIWPEGTVAPEPDIFATSGGLVQTYTLNDVIYKSHTFLSDGFFSVEISSDDQTAFVNADVLLVGGGGGGGRTEYTNQFGGGGGAGGFLATVSKLRKGTYTVIVGNGGVAGQNGEDSTFNYLVAKGGGSGGGFGQNGRTGGSGGGAGAGTDTTGGAGTAYQGFAGGSVIDTFNGSAAGGGGASVTARDITEGFETGNGANGLTNNYRDGSNTFYAGGGAGGKSSFGVTGGTGGGGSYNGGSLGDGTPNTGGGGAGGLGYSTNGGTGGKGIVIIRYRI